MKLFTLGMICLCVCSCAGKPGSGGGWVVGNPMMPEEMAKDAAKQPVTPNANTCECKTKKCDCSPKNK